MKMLILGLCALTLFAASPAMSAEQRDENGEVKLRGEVVDIDRASGRVALSTEAGRLVLSVSPRELAGVRVGDVLEVVLLAPDDDGDRYGPEEFPAVSPRTI